MSDTFDKPVIGNVASQDDSYVDDPLTADQELVLKTAWIKLDDLFDSLPGGPHLKDRSKTGWDAAKSSLLFSYALARINYGNPPLNFNATDFPYNTDGIVLSQALVVEIIKHFIRSYTEQPQPQGGGSYAYLSRRDYAQLWQPALEMEESYFQELVRIFRRKYLGLGATKGLIAHKGIYSMPPNWGRLRSRGFRWF